MSNRRQRLATWVSGCRVSGSCSREGDYRFGRNGQVAVSRERGAQGSCAAACQTTDEQPDAAGRHPSDQHPHARAAAEEGSAAPAFTLLGSGQGPGVDVILGAVDLQLGQRQRHHRSSFEHAPPVGHQNFAGRGGTGGTATVASTTTGATRDPVNRSPEATCLTSMVSANRNSNRLPRGNVSGASGAGVRSAL